MLDFLYTAVSWVLLRWHQLFSVIGIDKDSGINWALSIIFLVVTARLLLFRVFVRQVHYQRRMQEMQPRLQAIREKYKNDKSEQQRQMMKLQQEEGFNPITGCLPMLLQFPIFIALFHVLRHIANSNAAAEAYRSGTGLSATQIKQLTLYTFTQQQTASASNALLFKAPLAGSLRDNAARIMQLHGDLTSTRTVTLILVVVSAGATLFTQFLARRALTVQPEGTAATMQRLMLIGIPASVVISGLFFPLGTLIYWFTSNLWTMFQQMYILKFHPNDGGSNAVPAGTVGKTLAPKPGVKPKPGAKPQRGINTAATSNDTSEDDVSPATSSEVNNTDSTSTQIQSNRVPKTNQTPHKNNTGPRVQPKKKRR